MMQPPINSPEQTPSHQQAPQVDPVKHRVHHSYIWMSLIQVAISFLFVIAVTVIPTFLGQSGISSRETLALGLVGLGIVVLVLILFGIIAVVQYFSYKNLYYMLGDEEFSLYSGIFNKKRVHVPYQRVQSVNQKTGLIQRIIGVCTVNIDTAGGAQNKAIVIPYLQNSAAEKLRGELFARKQYILSQQNSAAQQRARAAAQANQQGQTVGGTVQQGTAPAQSGKTSEGQSSIPAASSYQQAAMPHAAQSTNVLDAPAEIMTDMRGIFGDMQVDAGEVSYEYGLSNKELVFSALSNNTGFAFILIIVISTAFGLMSQLFATPFGEYAYQEGMMLINNVFAGRIVWFVVGSIIVALIVIWVLSIIGTCISYGGFRAVRRQNRIEVDHGLLQHRFHGVDVDRVQSVIIKQSFIRRLIGYCELSLGKIDAISDAERDQGRTLSQLGMVIHPFVKMDKVPEILAGLVPEFADVPQDTIKLPRVSLRRALIRRCILHGNGFWLAVIVTIFQVGTHLVVSSFPAVASSSDMQTFLAFIDPAAYILYAIAVIVLIMEAVNAVLWFRGSSFAYNKTFMQVSNGGFSRESVSFPRKKIQYGFTKTNPFQRTSQVATINARTAAGINGTTIRLLDVDEKAAQKWLDWVIPGNYMIK